MAKKNNKEKEEVEVKSPVITAAAINDGFCNYSYEIKKGIGSGAIHNVKDNKHIVDADMGIAFFALSVHLAVIDDIFKHSDQDVISIKELRKSELAALYNVTGFKIKGQGDDEKVILIGTKEIGCSNAYMHIETPPIPLAVHPSYRWAAELKEAVDNARMEVELYSEGKYTEVEQEEKADPDQLALGANENDIDLEAGAVN